MAKKIILREDQGEMLFNLLGGKKTYAIDPEKVLLVKKFLDDTFQRADYENTGANGLPCVSKIVIMKSPSGNDLGHFSKENLLDCLIDKHKNMFADHIEREAFLKQVMEDWYDNKIKPYGGLSVNYLSV